MVRPLAVVLASLIALTMLTTAGAASAPRSVPAPAVHSALLVIQAENGNGVPTNNFAVGLGSGDIFFLATDTGTDTTGVVTIHDQNYSRDHLPNPVANWTVTFNASANQSYGTPNFYAIPFGLNFSGLWTINLTAGGVTTGELLTVNTYYVGLDVSQQVVLPGHSTMLFYQVYSPANEAAFTNTQSVQLVGSYYTSGAVYAPIPGLPHDLSTGGSGNVSWTLPKDASSAGAISFRVWANQSGGVTNWSRQASLLNQVRVGNLSGIELGFLNCGFTNCTTFQENTPIVLEIFVIVTAGFTRGSGPGLTATLSFASNGKTVTAPSGTPTSVTTNASGYALVVFNGSTSVFSTTHPNDVQVNVTDPNEPGLNVGLSINFYLAIQTSSARLQLVFGQPTYFSGDVVTASWSLGSANNSAPMGWLGGFWGVYISNNVGYFQTLTEGYVTSKASSGTLTFTLPTGYTGSVEVFMEASNATMIVSNYAQAIVSAPTLLLNPSEIAYQAGDTVNVAVSTEGTVFNGATLYETSTDSNGNILSSGTVSGGSFPIHIPSVSPPTSVSIRVAAQTSALGVISVANALISLEGGYTLTVSVSSTSTYSDGSFQPGQSITISYSLSALGSTKLPSSLGLEIVPGNDVNLYGVGALSMAGARTIATTSTSGSVSFTIPSNSPNGFDSFVVVATPGGGACTYLAYTCSTASQLTVNVNSNPPALGFEVSSGVGLTLGWLILLILIVLIVIVGILWARRRRGGGGHSGGTSPPKPYTSTSPATAPTTETPSGGSAGWSEGSETPSGGSSPPPMPSSNGKS